MVVCTGDLGLQADVVFVIEGTAVNGAYINDLKTNYINPSLEYFSQGNLDENNYISDSANTLFGIVVYHAADCLPHPSTDTFGPFSSPTKLSSALDKLELLGGKGESQANIAEGLATALHCFEELQQKRDATTTVQKHCILVCNSPPYSLPVLESHTYSGKTAEQLAAILQENNIHFSIISPRKIPSLYKLFEKSGGDLPSSQNKNYAKDPRHLVLLRGFSLKERPISPPPGNVTPSQSQLTPGIPMTSLPSPLPGSDSPIPGTTQGNNILVNNPATGVGANVTQNNVYRPQAGQGMPQNMVQQQKAVVNVGQNRMMGNNPLPMMQVSAPPGYHATTAGHMNRTSPHWPMPPPAQQPRPYMQQPNQQVNTTQGSALIAQLTQPPSSIPGTVNQFGQMTANSPINKISMNPQANVQTSLPQSQPGIQISMAQGSQPNQVVTSQAQMPPSQPTSMGTVRERHNIWQGHLEWFEKTKNAADQQKVTKLVPCHVSANSKDGEPELKADGWPSKLIMQLMPKQLIGNIGGAYLKNSKSVLFHPQPCDALETLTRVMSSGFAGCVHFPTPACDIKVLILLYTADKRAYLGFIPNDQVAFVDRLRRVIQQQKSTQQQMRQGGPAGPALTPQVGQVGTPNQIGANNPATSQNAQQNLLISQTNTIAMGGGQITQNVASNPQPGQPMGGIMGQNVSADIPFAGGVRPNIRMPGAIQQPGATSNQPPMQPGGMMQATPGQRGGPFENQIEVERRQNLEKINQLKQTLEAAQQQEQQYKSQLERISHMKTSQLQEQLQQAQQHEMHFKMLDQQRQAALVNQGNPQAATAQQQQRLMRPMSNNPGLRHLLQQQPQYRQLINAQQIGGNGPKPQMGQQIQNAVNPQQNTFDDVPSFDFNNIM